VKAGSFKEVLQLALLIASTIALAIPILSPSPVHATMTPHDPIFIIGNGGFTAANGVVSGSGMANDPYVIENWDINASTANGIEIRYTTAYFVIRNCFVENGEGAYYDGIYLYNVANGGIDNNTCRNNYCGIYLESSHNNTLNNNICENNKGHGIHFVGSDKNILTNNTCLNNGWDDTYYSGIVLNKSTKNNLSNNFIENSGAYGIFLCNVSINNVIRNNFIENHGYVGIGLSYSSNNRIYHNNFVNNLTQAYDESSNFWDDGYPSGGNYWSDYTGVDNYWGENQDIPGSDGIGDISYSIPGDNNQDCYPLMNPIIKGVEVSISPDCKEGLPRDTFSYTVTVVNTGNIIDSYALTVNDNTGWGPSISPTWLVVLPGENRATTLTVTIPENARGCTRDTITVAATSQTDSMVSDNYSCVAHVQEVSRWPLIIGIIIMATVIGITTVLYVRRRRLKKVRKRMRRKRRRRPQK